MDACGDNRFEMIEKAKQDLIESTNIDMENCEQKYQKALSRAKYYHDRHNIQFLENIFPELRESGDERIRKALLEYFGKQCDMSDCNGIYGYEVYDWLKKQGEKVDAIENFDTEFEKQVSHLIASAINKEHEYNDGFVKWTANALLNYAKHELEKQGELKPTDYHLANEKMEIERWKEACKAACSDRNYRSHYGLTETRDDYFVDGVQWADENPKHKPVWSEEDEKILKELVEEVKDQLDSVPSPDCMDKEDEKVLKQLNKWMDWLKSIKNRVQLQPNQEWSEEDEKMRQETIDWFEKKCFPYALESENPARESIKWLKSLKPNNWKPSEEQIKSLRIALQSMPYSKDKETALSLLEQLVEL